jgi:hypothetical protein
MDRQYERYLHVDPPFYNPTLMMRLARANVAFSYNEKILFNDGAGPLRSAPNFCQVPEVAQ